MENDQLSESKHTWELLAALERYENEKDANLEGYVEGLLAAGANVLQPLTPIAPRWGASCLQFLHRLFTRANWNLDKKENRQTSMTSRQT